MKRILSMAILGLFLAGCETFPEVEDQILNNASNACTQAETNSP